MPAVYGPSPFLFTVCQVGAEPALKKEIAREHPELRFAYSRPGFVTFKQAEGAPLSGNLQLKSVFARAYGISRGKTSSPDEVRAYRDALAKEGAPVRLHLWERERYAPQEAPKGFVPGAWEAQAREKLAPLGLAEGLAQPGERVLDVVLVEENEWWIGDHLHSSPAHSPYAGGNARLKQPEHAPSRAYVKLREALLWSQAPIRKGDIAVEIGSAPGGAVLALLEEGMNVVGIDPAAMDERVVKFGGQRFIHITKKAREVMREDLPEEVHWVLVDVHQEPGVAIPSASRLLSRMQDTLLGLFFTVKLNTWELADHIPQMVQDLRDLGMARVRATQLASNHQEILIYGITRKGQMRG